MSARSPFAVLKSDRAAGTRAAHLRIACWQACRRSDCPRGGGGAGGGGGKGFLFSGPGGKKFRGEGGPFPQGKALTAWDPELGSSPAPGSRAVEVCGHPVGTAKEDLRFAIVCKQQKQAGVLK